MRNINTPKTKVYVRGDAFGEDASEPLPDVASIEAIAQQIKDELQPFLP